MLHVLTLNWNGKARISDLNKSMANLDMPEYIWHIKDNGSIDGSIDEINSWGNKNINIIKTGHNNDTFAYGTNICFNTASPKDNDYVLLLNNDIIFNKKDDIKNMINILDQGVGIVGAKLMYKNTNTIQHNGVVFDKKYSLPVHYGVNMQDSLDMSKSREFQAVTGAVMMMKAETFRNIHNTNKSKNKGLDEDFIWCYEDIAACISVKYHLGKKIVCYSGSNISHEESASLKINPINRLFLGKNIQTMHLKYKHLYKIDRELYDNVNYNLFKEGR